MLGWQRSLPPRCPSCASLGSILTPCLLCLQNRAPLTLVTTHPCSSSLALTPVNPCPSPPSPVSSSSFPFALSPLWCPVFLHQEEPHFSRPLWTLGILPQSLLLAGQWKAGMPPAFIWPLWNRIPRFGGLTLYAGIEAGPALRAVATTHLTSPERTPLEQVMGSLMSLRRGRLWRGWRA